MNEERLPLEGVRILDFTTILAGPHLTQWLGVMGAEVIKVETHLRVESRLVSVIAKTPRRMGLNESDSFAIHNYSKKSITLNMKHPDALAYAKRLVQASDVVAENFAGGTMQKWGLGLDVMQALRPGLIVYAGSGYGRYGPRASAPLYAPVADAQNGLVALNGYPGGEPYTLGSSGWTDMAMAMHGAFAVLAALRHRQETGEGQFIDTAMIEVQAQFLCDSYMDFVMNGRVGKPQGNRSECRAPHGVYRAHGDDRWVAISVGTQAEWSALCGVMGNPAWCADPRFADELLRWEHQEALDAHLSEWTVTRTAQEIAAALQAAGVIASASLDFEELLADEQMRERGFFRRMAHPAMGELLVAEFPYKVIGGANGSYFHSPLLGEHNNQIYGDLLGLSSAEIARLESEKVFF